MLSQDEEISIELRNLIIRKKKLAFSTTVTSK